MWPPSPQRMLSGLVVAVLMCVGFATITAVWANPFFIRMTPVQGFEVPFLVVLSLLSGAYVTVRRPACSTRGATGAGVLGFLGVACPTCNTILLLLFGGEALLAYFEPVRMYVMLASIVLMSWMTWREVLLARELAQA